ncbi:hypothetical protein RJ639_033617 [Escallonia herrerae]|uniref:Uncharacterized protein n=1 Tax=Escallonia herrerae TaxID=1293975 RepID=A0AA88WV06_9ASTE|nr:hypothetical protein RJ639_033617 [Escallonia herrerae]
MESTGDSVGLEYWLRWQVPVCALLIVIPLIVSVVVIKRVDKEPLTSSDLWMPCWRNLSPLWLLFYRAFAFVAMDFVLHRTAAAFGPVVFFFYTQWTFVLVIVYFVLGTIISAHGCWMYFKQPFAQYGERSKFLKRDSEEKESESTTASKEKEKQRQFDQLAGFWGNLMQSIYHACAGAVMLTDVVFWCLLLPFMLGETFRLTLILINSPSCFTIIEIDLVFIWQLIGCMHSLNAVFLLVDSALNSLPFPWHGLTYFVLWSFAYIVFQWVVHACGVTWWPYPFLELSTTWAPLWYFGLALVHLPCYGLYVLIVKAKGSMFSRMFPRAFVRWEAVVVAAEMDAIAEEDGGEVAAAAMVRDWEATGFGNGGRQGRGRRLGRGPSLFHLRRINTL